MLGINVENRCWKSFELQLIFKIALFNQRIYFKIKALSFPTFSWKTFKLANFVFQKCFDNVRTCRRRKVLLFLFLTKSCHPKNHLAGMSNCCLLFLFVFVFFLIDSGARPLIECFPPLEERMVVHVR